MLLQVLQEHPPSEDKRVLPYLSFIAYVPVSGTVTLFNTDPQTGEVRTSRLAQSDHPLLTALLLFGTLFPFLFSVLFVAGLWLKGRRALQATRKARLTSEALLNKGIAGTLKLDSKIATCKQKLEELELAIAKGKGMAASRKEQQEAARAVPEREKVKQQLKKVQELAEMEAGDEVEVRDA